VIDLIHSNKGREKTEEQKNYEVKTLKSTLAVQAKARQIAGVKGPGACAPGARVADQIAEHMNISPDEVKARIAVHDDEYRVKFFEKMRAAGGRDKLVSQCEEEWDTVRERQSGGLKPRTAEDCIKRIQKAYLEECPSNKNAKIGKSKSPKILRGRPMKKIFIPSADGWEVRDTVSYRTTAGRVDVGATFGADGESVGLGFSRNGFSYVLPWDTLIAQLEPV
jgi:hypothetical protein